MRSAIEETYEDVEDMIHHVSHRFLRRKGIGEYDYEEWHGEACCAFARSFGTFDPSQARFTTHLWHGIWHALSDKLQRDAPHWKTARIEPDVEDVEDESCLCSGCEELLSSLSQDAKMVVELVLGAGGLVEGKESSPGEIRVGLYQLLTNFGWSFRRIVETFHEIKTVLLD